MLSEWVAEYPGMRTLTGIFDGLVRIKVVDHHPDLLVAASENGLPPETSSLFSTQNGSTNDPF